MFQQVKRKTTHHGTSDLFLALDSQFSLSQRGEGYEKERIAQLGDTHTPSYKTASHPTVPKNMVRVFTVHVANLTRIILGNFARKNAVFSF